MRFTVATLLLAPAGAFQPFGAVSPVSRRPSSLNAVNELDRRDWGRVVGSSLGVSAAAATASPARAASPVGPMSPRATFYGITKTDPPAMQPLTSRGERRVITELAQLPAVVVGDHGSEEDGELEARLLKQLAEAAGGRGIVVALAALAATEQGQRALDAYVGRAEADGADAEAALRGAVECTEGAAFDGLLPLLRAARSLGGVRLAAAGVADADAALVRRKGLEALGRRSGDFVRDPQGFVKTMALPGFKRYSDVVITDLFERAVAPGDEAQKGSLATFFAAQVDMGGPPPPAPPRGCCGRHPRSNFPCL